MKSFLKCFILCGLVFLVACSGDSPSPSNPGTASTGDVWLITSLVSSDDNPIVNTTVLVTATATKNGDPAPDGTQVEFIHNGGGFVPSNGTNAATVLTTGGQASIRFGATDAGLYTVQARVRTVTSQIQIAYREPDNTGGLQLWNINPAEGSYNGGETVVLTGKGIAAPVEVFFTVQGQQYQAIVDQVVPSVPATSAGTITLRSPLPTAADTGISSAADVKVVVKVGTTDEEQQTYPAVFTYVSDSVILGDPVIFGIEPYYGRSEGGETAMVLGLNFGVDVTKELVQNFDEVYFTFRGQDLLASVERWSASQIEVITPRFSLTPLTDDEVAGIKITQEDGDTFEKDDLFIVRSDLAVPVITGISPTAGPIDGGTIVTINGHGFEIPVQVHFGDLEATGVQLYDDQSFADNDLITCMTPDYSQQGQIPPYPVAVRVTNLETGLEGTSTQNFTFGSGLYVGQANPTEGQIGDLLTLFGAGFEDPLTVWFNTGGEIEFDVISVTGTEITLRSPPTMAPTCNDRSGNFRVVLNESNREEIGGNYTLLGSNPTITSVDPIFVNETAYGNGVDPNEIDIYGVRFSDDLLVLIDNWTIDPSFVSVESSEHIHVSQIPAPNDLNLDFDTADCTTDLGFPGTKNVPTPVNVTVRNLPLGCADTLNSTLVYVPEDQECVAAPDLIVEPSSFNFGEIRLDTCSAGQTLILRNEGGGDLIVSGLAVGLGYAFNAAGTITAVSGPITIPPLGSYASQQVFFCPTALGTTPASLVVDSNDSDSPTLNSLTGSSTINISTSPEETWAFPDDPSGDTCGLPQVLTITNIGSANDLTLQSVLSSDDTSFHITNPPAANFVLAPGGTYPLSVEFCPDSASPPEEFTAELSIDHDATDEVSPITITMTGTGT